MRTKLLVGFACLLMACGGSASEGDSDAGDSDAGADAADAEPEVIRTGEVCKVSADCKMPPGRAYCPEPRKAVRYDEPTCGADQRCTWYRIEDRCGLRCEDGVCITAGR